MNFRIFFDALPDELFEAIKQPNTMLHQVILHKENFPNWQDIQAAIIGISDDGGADEIRKRFYSLKKGNSSAVIADLGNLRKGVDEQETLNRLKEVCNSLMETNVIPIILGGAHHLDLGQFLAYEDTGKHVNFLNVDAFFDMYGSEEFGKDRHHIHRILMHEPPLLFHYSHLAYQTYLVDPETINILEKLHYELYRIGRIRENLQDIEPVIRNADMMSFDLSSLRQMDAPGTNNPQPFGLTGEEACQICWYAGMSPRMSSVGLYGFSPFQDEKGQTSGVIATMLWYFLEGFGCRNNGFDEKDSQITKYIVSLNEDPHKLTFYKHNISEQWWMEVPFPNDKKKFARNSIVPCSYEDYTQANKGEIPVRWLLTHAKLI
ncbi:MAG: formimidoylglutamase [Cytophagaceae bacterium]